ncbi:MAG TPA: cbb3-type cytochrome c oxidase subunit II [Gammaproteobacteria bacterium]|nr:cbb3-type cytochrome c oxidase subunit II [Gammaproteobacteria bacterium]
MTKALAILAGAALILMYAALMLLVLPSVQLQTGTNAPDALEPYSDVEQRGRELYISLGCVYCHSQQPRDPSQAPDMKRGWGRPSVPADYSYDQPHLLGTSRTGPDLFNIGARQPSIDWHLAHLYNPRAVVPWSTMPSYPFLFHVTDIVVDGMYEVKLPEEYQPEYGHVIATPEAMALVKYLLSLDHTYPVESLQPDKKAVEKEDAAP